MPETLDSHGSAVPPTAAPPLGRTRSVREWPVPRKVALVLAIPLLLAVALGGMRIQSELATAGAAEATASQVTVLGPAVGYLAAAEDAAVVFRSTEDEEPRAAALAAVNDAAARLERAWSSADLSDAQRAEVRSLLDSTQGLRDGSAYDIVSTSSRQLADLESAVTLGVAGMTDAGSRAESLIGAVGHLNAGRLAVTQQQLLLNPRPEIIPKNELYGYLGVESAAIGSLELLLPDDAQVTLLRQYNDTNSGLLGIGTPELKGQAPLRLYDAVAADLLGQVQAALDAQAAASTRTALVTALLVALALLVAVALALVVARLLVRPIREVRDGALAVAHDELPETVRRIRAGEDPGAISTIPVTTHEEMGQLARAVDDLHGTAVRLARDEAELRSRVADMFVTLSRRNTSLVNQQLSLIERLERDEEDPQRLESLFRLDHLASRMRRTAESLVVLADAPTTTSEQDSLLVDEALQAATAGVQDYQRVEVSGAPALRITGAAAPDLVHLFTELVDNALSFSPPTTPVRVTASTPAGLLRVAVTDAGLGIDDARLAELNETLRTGAEVTADTARRMGLFVVARLARRHGLTVTLEHNAEGGTTAQVFIPRALLTPVGTDAPLEADPVALTAVPAADAEPESDPVAESLFRRPTEPAAPVALAAAPAPEATPEPDAEPQPEPVATPAVPGLDALSAVINANIGLPQRRPGTAPQPEPLTPVLPRRQRAEEPVAEVVAEPEVIEEVEATEVVEVVEVIEEPEVVEPSEPDVAEALDPEAGLEVPDTIESDVLAQVTPLVPVAAEPAAPAAYALDGHADDDETPLFRMLRSSWFSNAGGEQGWGSGEADAGWQAADRVAVAAPSQLTRSGLPVRDPGNRLVPGGVAQAAPSLHRDPEAIRARLAAHAAGVARGRNLAGAALQQDRPTDTPEDVTP